MNNHLIIGLGGTGGKIIRSFRKTIFQEFRHQKPDGVAIGYLYVDSSGDMMALEDPSWKVLGTSVQLGKNSQLKIRGTDLPSVLDNINNFPGVKPWLGDRNTWKEILNSIVTEVLGGQKRRLGRFLFANNVRQFNAQLNEIVRGVQKESGTVSVTFHICCGLAGGTGSGCLIDVISQIRDAFNDPREFRIIVYALLPDKRPPQGWDTGNYHANGYAALLELNALSVGQYAPYDLTGQKGRLKLQDPFNGCYLFTNENENGMTVDVDKEVPNIVADFLYQKIVAVKDIGHWDSLRRMENAENGDGTPETAPGSKTPERSKRFLTFGIKRLAVPEEEILEYLTYNFTTQAALQLLYNNWQDSIGFSFEPRSQDFREFVQQKETLVRWKLTDDHMCLSLGILPSDISNKKWKPIQTEWQDFITNSKLMIRESAKQESWLDELEKAAQVRHNEAYRGLGVKNFYRTKRQGKSDIAREIVRGIEMDLFGEWRNGAKSMVDVERLLSALISSTQDRVDGVDDKIRHYRERQEQVEGELTSIKREWSKIGFLGGLIGKKHDKVFDSHASWLQELYISRTWDEAWQFAKELLLEFRTELDALKKDIDECTRRIRQAYESFQDDLAARCNDDGTPADLLKAHLIRFYEPDLVKEVTSRFVRDETLQRGQTSDVRSSLVAKLGESPSFGTFSERISPIVLKDTLESVCEENAKRAHENLIDKPREKLLGVSIIERLKNQYGSNLQGLRSYITQLTGFAGNYVSFSDIERGKKADGIPTAPNCLSNFSVILPNAPEHSDFMPILKNIFQESRQLGAEIIETDVRPNEITLISITNLFPLRFLRQVEFLKEKYEQRIQSSDTARVKLEVHTEGDGTQHPPIYLSKPPRDKAMAYFLLAKSMDILMQRKNQVTGIEEIVLVAKDEDGLDKDPIHLGSTLADVPENLDEHLKLNLLAEEVNKVLQSKVYLHKDSREQLKDKIVADIDKIKADVGPDDDLYKVFLAGARKAIEILKSGS